KSGCRQGQGGRQYGSSIHHLANSTDTKAMIFNRRHLALFTIVLPMFLSACWSDALPTLPDQAFTQLDGTEMRTSDFRGQVLVLNFWATSCTTCVKEMPQLVAMHERFKARGLDTLAVAMSYDPPAY